MASHMKVLAQLEMYYIKNIQLYVQSKIWNICKNQKYFIVHWNLVLELAYDRK